MCQPPQTRNTYGVMNSNNFSSGNPPRDSLPRDNSVFTVSQLNQRAKQLLEISFASVRVEGEISNLSRPSSGHWYFTLKDAGAQVRCAMFRSRTAMLKFQPKEGDKIEVRGKVSLYENRGDYQLIVDAMKPAGEGALLLAFQQLKQKLTALGLFDQERKRPLPQAIRRVAVITSPGGAAVHDMLTVLKRRWPMLEVDIYPALVQGREAPPQLINALLRANRDAQADVIILGRGGGSLEDLWCFNDEQLAHAIAASAIPVISAVGHETDFTIADFVADLRAPTPSAAAEVISPDQQQIRQRAGQLYERLLRTQHQKLSQSAQYLLQLKQRLRGPQHILQNQSQQLDHLELRLQQVMKQKLTLSQHQLSRVQQRLGHQHPQLVLDQYRKTLEQIQRHMEQAAQNSVRTRQTQLETHARLLHSVSPLNVLNRGYSISLNADGQALHNASDLRPGDIIETRLHKDRIKSQITEVIHEKG